MLPGIVGSREFAGSTQLVEICSKTWLLGVVVGCWECYFGLEKNCDFLGGFGRLP